MRRTLLIVVAALLVAAPLLGQIKAAKEPPPAPQTVLVMQKEQGRDVLRELEKYSFRARVDIPAVDFIFVQDGKIIEAMYRDALKENPRALAAGAVTKVSSVKVLDHGIQVFLATDKCAVIGVSAGTLDTATTTTKELVDAARKAIAPLFEIIEPAVRPREEKPGAKEDVPDKDKEFKPAPAADN